MKGLQCPRHTASALRVGTSVLSEDNASVPLSLCRSLPVLTTVQPFLTVRRGFLQSSEASIPRGI